MVISILIVTYNSRQIIDNCLSSIYNSKLNFPFEIIVVDNNSNDETVYFIEQNYANVILIKNTYNYGFSYAMNQAYNISCGKYIILFNPDAIFLPDSLQSLVLYFQNNSQLGLVGPVELNNDKVTYSRNKFPYFRKSIILQYFNFAQSSSEIPFNIDYLEGTALAVLRDSLIDNPNQLLTSDSFLFWEEYILAQRIKNNGFEINYCNDYKIEHTASTSFKFNPVKLFYARRLSLVVENKIRKEKFGIINVILNNFISGTENLLFYLLLRFKKSNNDEMYNWQLSEYLRMFKIYFCHLFTTNNKLKKINKETELFFNQ